MLLWAKSSVGKSPLSWWMARSIGTGTAFFGLPATQGRVLYIEIDTPEQSAATRLKKLPPVDNVWFLFMEPLSLRPGTGGMTAEQLDALIQARDNIRPDFVVVNTLRNCHDMDDRESIVPKIVYTFFRTLFKGAAVMFVHHNRKSPLDPKVEEIKQESFSGSRAFVNDAQVGLHLGRFRQRDGRSNLRLYHVKSQVSELLKPMPLKLSHDGSLITCPLYEELLMMYTLLNEEPDTPLGDLDKKVAEHFRISISTAKSRRLAIMDGQFPGSRAFLAPQPGEEEEEE